MNLSGEQMVKSGAWTERRGLGDGEGLDWLNSLQAFHFPGKFLERLQCTFKRNAVSTLKRQSQHQETITDHNHTEKTSQMSHSRIILR